MRVQIFKGIQEPLRDIFGHEDVTGLERFSFFEKDHIKGKSFHIAAHVIHDKSVHQGGVNQVQSHAHDFDEINILISANSCLKYEMEFDGKTETVFSPSLIYIPSGTQHRAEAVEGSGIFLCIHLDQVSDEF
jgi:hypothetical protein